MRPKSDSHRRLRLTATVAVAVVCLGRTLAAGQQSEKPLPDAPQQTTAEKKSFFARWAEAYRQAVFGPASASSSSSPSPPRRGVPSPLDSPPFPNSDWSYGGSPVIGEPDTNSYPLMTAINGASSRTKLYGWVEPTLNFGTSTDRNAPEANDVYSNRFEMNQLVFYADRL